MILSYNSSICIGATAFPRVISSFVPSFYRTSFEYLRAIPDLCNPTLSIPLASGLACGGPLPDYYPYESLEPEITRYAVVFCRFTVHVVRITSHFPFRFMAANHEGKGWVVKAPYTTNCAFIRTCRTPQAVRSAVVKADELYGDLIPYVMLQPAMFSRAEDKIVFMRGKPCYVADKKLNPCKRSSVVARDDAIAFASQALKRLKAAVPSFLSDGLVRVDIFCTLSEHLFILLRSSCAGVMPLEQKMSKLSRWFGKVHFLSFCINAGIQYSFESLYPQVYNATKQCQALRMKCEMKRYNCALLWQLR